MEINATLPEKGRDLRLDLFRGVANWAIFLDHIPDNVVNWITTRNYGFSDAADLFVFISGYTASFVYARMMLERGFIVGATRLTKRVWQLYVAHIILFVIYIVSIGYVAQRYSDPEIINEFNVAGLVDSAIETLRQGLLLKFKPVNLDVLPLYIVLMGLFPAGAVDDAAPARSDDVGVDRAVACGPAFRLELHSLSRRNLVLQPVLLAGAVCVRLMVRARRRRKSMAIINAPFTLYFCIGYLILGLVMTMAGKFPDFGNMFPHWLYSTFNPNDKTNLAPYRFLHFVVIVILVITVRAEGLAGPGMEGVRPAHCLRSAIAGSVLCRRLPLLCRTFRIDDELRLAVCADFRQRDRHRDHDHRRLLHFLVEATGQAGR